VEQLRQPQQAKMAATAVSMAEEAVEEERVLTLTTQAPGVMERVVSLLSLPIFNQA
jgi:hypothetical protein